MTPLEFQARAEVREFYMATWRAEIRNAPHFTKKDKKPWTSDDFLATPEAAARRNQKAKDEFESKRAQLRANAALAAITKNTEDGLPDWAQKKWGAA